MPQNDSNLSLANIIYISLKPIFKIYLILGVGFFLAKRNILTVESSKNISTIAMLVLVPCLAFTKIVSNIDNSDIKQIATIVILTYFMMFGEAILVFIVGVLMGCPKAWYGGLIACGLIPNVGDIPISYLQSLQTSNVLENVDKGVSYVFIYVALQMIIQFNLGGYKLIEWDFKRQLKSKEKEKTFIKEIQDFNENEDVRENNNNTVSTSFSTVSEIMNPIGITSRSSQLLSNSISRIASVISVGLPISIYENELKSKPPEDMIDIIKVYSRYDEFANEQEKSKSSENYSLNLAAIKQFCKSIKKQKLKTAAINFSKSLLISFLQPVSLTLVISIVTCMIPWVRALFVTSKQVTLSSAPDGLPPLSFIIDFTSYVGAAQVPFGLLLLGGTIGRLKIKDLPKGLWKTPVSITFIRLFVFPVIGCSLNSVIFKKGLFYNEDIFFFVSNINTCMPPATTLFYLTAMYTRIDSEDTLQMDCLALVYICHFIFLVICLPFTTCYTLKVSLGY